MKDNKKEYNKPEVEISKFSTEDNITTSTNMGGNLPGDVHEGIGGA